MTHRHGSSNSMSLTVKVFLASLTAFCLAGKVLASAPQGCPATGARIFLAANGTVMLNGRKVEPGKLSEALGNLKPKATVVCYSRENPGGEPPPEMSVVMDAIMAARLPVGLFTDSTFSTPVKLP